MCGIAGIVGPLSADRCLEVVKSMSEAISHRGPDNEGYWSEDGFGFGTRRLSIIDLAGGHQPMWDEASGIGVVFNGEIYNYRSLREELQQRGYTFLTQSDTEVVLKGIVDVGLGAVHRWNGMFAAAAWDSRQKKLLLIRDRMGVKPLYFFYDEKTFLFASEIKAILASGLAERSINRQAVWDYLTFRYVPGPESIWNNIRKLSPGCVLEFVPGQPPREIRYWQTDVISRDGLGKSDSQLDEEFASLFLDAVKLRLEASDVPVGILLSGGLDSSSIAAVAAELGHKRIHTFSIGFDDGGDYSELPFARKIARHVGARYDEIVIGKEHFLEMLPEGVYFSDEPLADLASIPLSVVCRLARRYVKVVLSGDGGDEVLGGYELDQLERVWNAVRALQKIPRPVLKIGEMCARAFLPDRYQRTAQRVIDKPLADWNRHSLMNMTGIFGEEEKKELWSTEEMKNSERQLRADYNLAGSSDPLQQVLSVNQKSWLVEDILMKSDKMSMANSLELRTPFLDYRLIEWANRQPNWVKVRWNGLGRYQTKNILRRFCETRLPQEVLRRPKRGFPVPAYGWLQGGLQDWARKTLLSSESRLAKSFRPKPMVKLVNKSALGDLTASHKVWSLIILELWLQTWDLHLDS